MIGNTVAGVLVQEGSHVNLYEGTNTLEGNGADLILSGGSTELTLDGSLNSTFERCVKRNTESKAHTGTTELTLLKSSLFSIPLWLIGKKIRMRVYGSMAGAGTKTVSIRLNSTDWLSFTSSAGSTQAFLMEADIFVIANNNILVAGRFLENGQSLLASQATQGTSLTGSGQSLRVYGTLSDAAGALTISAVEIFVS